MLVVLDHAVGRDIQSERLQDILGDFRMLDAAVDQQQIRCHVKAFISRFVVCKPSLHHLMHGSVIVLIVKAFQLKPFVAAFVWLACLKDHHAGDNIRPGDI